MALGLVLLLGGIGLACSVPVFRYALEHWRPDAYRLTLYHASDLSAEDQQLLAWLESQVELGANLKISLVDLRSQEVESVDRQRWEWLEEPPTPRLVVQLPGRHEAPEAIVGSLPWEAEQVRGLVHSPARADLTERLVDGQVVWLFLESGDSARDDGLYDLLEEQLAIQQATIELPVIDEDDLAELSIDPEQLKVQFSAMRITRTEPTEYWLREMLLTVEPDLRDEELVNQPMVFPVFGRGRALYALVGDGINAEMIAHAAQFLTGDCQCTIKAENPGVDLLLPMQWDLRVRVTEPQGVEVPLLGLASLPGLPQELPPSTASPQSTPSTTPAAEAGSDSSGPAVAESTVESAAQSKAAQSKADGLASTASAGSLDEISAQAAASEPPSGQALLLPLVVLLAIGLIAGLLGMAVLLRGTR